MIYKVRLVWTTMIFEVFDVPIQVINLFIYDVKL